MARKRIEINLAYDDVKNLYYAYFDYGRDGQGRRMRKTKTSLHKEDAKEALCRFEIRRPTKQAKTTDPNDC